MKTTVVTREQFKEIRIKLGLTQKEYAEKLGYSSNIVISYKETGVRKITNRDSVMVASLLNQAASDKKS